MRLLRYLVIVCLASNIVLGQTPDLTFQKLSTKDGLPSNFVSGITTDSKGYLWIATRLGLCRYDGYTFRKMPEDQLGAVSSICTLTNGTLAANWSRSGLFIIDSEGQIKTTVDSVQFKDADPVNDHFENLFADSQGNLWSSSLGLVRRHDLTHRKRYHYPIRGTNHTSEANHFFEDKQHRLWIYNEVGLYRFDKQRDRLRCVIGPGSLNKPLRLPIPFSAITEDNTGCLWLGTQNSGLIRYDPTQESIQRYPVAGTIQSMAFIVGPSGTSNLWLGCDNGLTIFHPLTKSVITSNELTKQGIRISQIHSDPQKNLVWLGTNEGLLQFRSGSTAIQTVLLPDSIVKLPVTIKSIVSSTPDTYWLGLSHTGVLQWNRKTNYFRLFPFPNESVSATLSWIDGKLWAATDRGIFRLENDHFHLVNLQTRFSSNSFQKVIIDKHSRLWVLHRSEGLQVFDAKTLRPLTLWNEQKALSLWQTNSYHDLTESADGKIWIAAWYPKSFGMIWYNESERRLQEMADFNVHTFFVGDYFNQVSTGKNGKLLFSGGGGVNITNAKGIIDTAQSVYARSESSLASDFCVGIAEDNEGELWIGTGEGLHSYNVQTKQIRRFTEVDGLLADDVTNGFLMTTNDLLLIGQQNGINLVSVAQLRQPAPLPQLTISSVQVNGQYRQLDASKPIALAKHENDLRFTFTTLSFSPNSATHFRYKLTGHENWFNLNTTNEVNLTNLKSGDYTLTIQNGDVTNRWNPRQVTIHFSIAPAWYETGWFRSLLVLALLGALYGFYRLRIGQERRRSELTRQRAEAETRALRAQMNPHFIFNCMNTIDAYILTNRPDDASIFLQKFSRLVRQVLENSRETLIPIEREIETLALYIELEEERADHRFGHRITVDPDTANKLIPPLILQPFVENAILHGLRHKMDGPGHLSITIEQHNNRLICIIEDNGIGRTKAEFLKTDVAGRRFQSLGSTVTSERIDSLQAMFGSEASYLITDQNPIAKTGTIVTLNLPLLS